MSICPKVTHPGSNPVSHICLSPQILDSRNTAMTRLCGNLLNNGDETAMLVCQQSPLIWQHDLLDDDGDGALVISSNSWQRQDCDSKTTQRPPQQLWQDWDIGASAISFNLVEQHPWQWWWWRIGNLLQFLMVVTLQYQRISNLLDDDGVQCVGKLLDLTSFVGS